MVPLAVACLLLAVSGGSSAAAFDETQVNSAPNNTLRTIQERMTITYDGPYGKESQANRFSDCNLNYWSYGDVNQVDIRSGDLIDSIRLRYGATYGLNHGGTGGVRSTLTLSPGEYITSAFGRVQTGSYLVSLGFRTSTGRVFGPFGDHQGATYLNFESRAPSGKRLVCIEGSVNVVSGITVIESLIFGWGALN